MCIQVRLIYIKWVVFMPVEVFMDQRHKMVSLEVEGCEGSELEENDTEEGVLDVLGSHVGRNRLRAWVPVGAPSWDHVTPPHRGVLTADAHNSNREVDQVDKENEAGSDEDGIVEEDLSKDQGNGSDTSRDLQGHELHEVILEGATLGHGHHDVVKTVRQKDHVSSVFRALGSRFARAERDVRLFDHLDVIFSAANDANGCLGSPLQHLRTKSVGC